MAEKKTAQNNSSKALRVAIGGKIRDYREKAKISQQEFCDMVGIKNRATLSLIENGEQSISIDILVRIVQVTKLDLMSLLDLNVATRVVLDTNIILNRPEMVKITLKDCDYVYIPRAVIEELNHQKDHGREREKRKASLCMSMINELRAAREDEGNFIINARPSVAGKTNDDDILQVAIDLAGENPGDKVYMLTNDKDFLLKDRGDSQNLRIIDSRQYNSIFAEPDGYDDASSQRFFMAVMKRNLEQAQKLMQKNERIIDVNFTDPQSGLTPLIKAVRNRDYTMIKYLLSLDRIDINAVDKQKYRIPPLSHAIQVHDITMVKMLVERNANVDEPSQNTTNYFNTPLMIAAWEGQLDMVRYLVENGACINQQDKKNGFTPLIKAVYRNKDDIVEYLLSVNADPTIYSFEAKTARDYAHDNKNMKILDLLKTE